MIRRISLLADFRVIVGSFQAPRRISKAIVSTPEA